MPYCPAVVTTAVVVALSASVGSAGDLNPPPGPVAETMKTLEEVEPRIALSQENTPGNASARFIITQPGSYYLTDGLSTGFDETAIRVLVGNVTIDLNGFDLEWGGDDALAIGIDATNRPGITVRNGNLNTFTTGVIAGSRAIVEGVTVASCDGGGIVVGDSSRVRSCRVIDNDGIGIMAGASAIIDGCHSEGNGARGIVCGDSCAMSGCVVIGNGESGVQVGEGSRITGTIARNNAIAGLITGPSSVIEGCASSDNTGTGISAGRGSSLTGCAADRNGGGIGVGDDSNLSGCVASENGSTGFIINFRTTMVGCSATLNQGDGILGVSRCTIIDCESSQNDGNGIEGFSMMTVRGCNVTVNGQNGIVAGQDSLVAECQSSLNGGFGIAIVSGSTVRDCHASGNSGGGVVADFDANTIRDNTLVGLANIFAGGDGISTSGGNNIIEGNSVTLFQSGIRVFSSNSTIVRNTARDNSSNYSIAGGNDVGTIQTSPVGAGAWDNFDF